MQTLPLSDALGVQLVDFDITEPASPETQAELRRLFQEHHLLVVRGQQPTQEDHDHFVGSLGPLQADRMGDEAGYVTNREDDPRSLFGPDLDELLWHNDGAYGPRPGIATSLWAVEVSSDAPPTLFANVVEIVDRFPAEFMAKVEEYRIQNVRDTAFNRTYERVPLDEILSSDEPDRYVIFEHPVLFQAPHLNRRAVIASKQMTSNVVGLSPEESDRFLDELYGYIYGAPNVYTHHWEKDDVVVWDNIALHHARPTEVGERRPRHLRRQCIEGWYNEDGSVIDWTLSRAKVKGFGPS